MSKLLSRAEYPDWSRPKSLKSPARWGSLNLERGVDQCRKRGNRRSWGNFWTKLLGGFALWFISFNHNCGVLEVGKRCESRIWDIFGVTILRDFSLLQSGYRKSIARRSSQLIFISGFRGSKSLSCNNLSSGSHRGAKYKQRHSSAFIVELEVTIKSPRATRFNS